MSVSIAPTWPTAAHPHAAVLRVASLLDQTGERWTLLRGDVGLERDGDLDVLVGSGGVRRLRSALREAGMVDLPPRGRGSGCFLAYDRERRRWVRLDVSEHVAFGGWEEAPSGVASAILARSRRTGGVVVPHPDDEFWALMLHCVLAGGRVPLKHRPRLQALAPEAGSTGVLARLLDRRTGVHGSAERLRVLSRAGDFPSVESAVRGLRRRWLLAEPRSLARLVSARSVGRLVDHLGRRRFGLVLPFDGTEESARAVAEAYPLPARVVRGRRSWPSSLVARYHAGRGRLVLACPTPPDAPPAVPGQPADDVPWAGEVVWARHAQRFAPIEPRDA